MKKKILVNAMMAMGCISATNVYSQFIGPAPVISGVEKPLVLHLAPSLELTSVGAGNMGLTLQQRRTKVVDNFFNPSIPLTPSSPSANTTNIRTLTSDGRSDGHLYRELTGLLDTGNSVLTLGTGNSTVGVSTVQNKSLILDLGTFELRAPGNLEAQGATFVSTVNSRASNDGLLMNNSLTPLLTGGGHLEVDQDRSGRVTTTQLIEQSGNANFKLMLDINSTLKNGASFNFLTETRAQQSNESKFDFIGVDGSNLYDTSYVINSAANTVCSNVSPLCAGGQQTVVVTFSRANNEYITKSFTSNHPSNDAALKLGTIAAQGLALGDMQTALTRLDINDFGYGNNKENLAVQVKRLAPIANNSFLIASTDAVKLATDAIDYRIAARRGNWSGFSDAPHSFWLKGLGAQSNSSGSVPLTRPGAQDVAGHDGFRTSASGVVMGFDKVVDNATYGVSYANVGTAIRQADDRNGESSRLQQHIWSLYAQRTDGPYFISGTVRYADGRVNGLRRTAIDRIADFDFSTNNTELSVKTGQRIDSSNGRSAFTPYIKGTGGFYKQAAYEETGAGALSLNVAEQKIQRLSAEAGLSMSHKGRFNGIKALTVMDVAVGKDVSISDQTIHARYTGATHTFHPGATGFTTPAEQWSSNYVNLKMNLQLEVAKRAMFKWGAAAEFRQGRQRFGTDVSMNWVF